MQNNTNQKEGRNMTKAQKYEAFEYGKRAFHAGMSIGIQI